MCGIIGINSSKSVSATIINSLKKLGSDAVSFHTKNSNIIEIDMLKLTTIVITFNFLKHLLFGILDLGF